MRLEYELSFDDENAVRRSSMRNLNEDSSTARFDWYSSSNSRTGFQEMTFQRTRQIPLLKSWLIILNSPTSEVFDT